MLRILLTAVTLLFALPAAHPAVAQTLREVEAWPHGDWRLATMVNVDYDRRFCAAETTSKNDQVLRIVLYEDDDAFLEILDPLWDFPGGEPLSFILVVDRDEWTVDGQGWAGAMSWDLIEPADRDDLVELLSFGRKLDIRMLNRSRVARFSLNGADDALAAALACWDAQRAGGEYTP